MSALAPTGSHVARVPRHARLETVWRRARRESVGRHDERRTRVPERTDRAFKNEKQYEALKDKGMSKERAAQHRQLAEGVEPRRQEVGLGRQLQARRDDGPEEGRRRARAAGRPHGRRSVAVLSVQVREWACGGTSSSPAEITPGSRRGGGRNACLGLGTHHRAAGSPVDRRRLRTPIVTRAYQRSGRPRTRSEFTGLPATRL